MRSFGLPPYIEISSSGAFPLLNAYYVRVAKFGNRTIEEVVQSTKVFQDGSTGLSVKEAQKKTKERIPITNVEDVELICYDAWQTHLLSNRDALDIVLNCSGLSDRFATGMTRFNIETLWKLRNKLKSIDKDTIQLSSIEQTETSSVVRSINHNSGAKEVGAVNER